VDWFVLIPENVAAQNSEREAMAERMSVFCSSDKPEKAFPAFMMAAGALALDMEVSMFFTMSGLRILKKGGAETICLPGAAKSLPEFVQEVQEAGAKLVACSAAFPIANCREEDLIDGVECGGVVSFVSGASGADLVMTFT
jgi:predicted peroxiredoxin